MELDFGGFNPIDMGSNAYFGNGGLGENGGGLAAGDGSDWLDWTKLPENVRNQFMTPRNNVNQGQYRGGETYRDSNFSLANLQNYLSSTGGSLRERNTAGGYGGQGTWERGIFDSNGQPVGDVQSGNYGSLNDDAVFALGSMFLNPFGGIVTGAAGGGGAQVAKELGGNAAAAQTINRGVSSALSVAGAGGEDKDILKAGFTGGLSSYMPNLAGYAGISDPNLQGAVNGAVRGGTLAAINGGNIKQAAIVGGTPSLASFLGDNISSNFQTLDDLPGTIGGGMYADDGVSYDGYADGSLAATSPDANKENEKAYRSSSTGSFSMPELGSFFSKLMPSSAEGWGDLAQGLMGMYAGHRQRRDAKEMMNSFKSNRGAYGQQLQKTLQRRDAAAGRRSDYSGREVELQAKMAELDSRNAPAMSQLSNQRLMGLAQMMQSGLRYGAKQGAFGDKYNPNVPQQPAFNSTMLPSTWTQPAPTNMGLNYDPNMYRDRYRLGGS